VTGRRLLAPGGVLAMIRVAAVPLFVAAETLVDHPAAHSGPFAAVLVLAAVYAAATLAGELAGRPVAPPVVLASIDLVLIAALVATSGGPFSELRYAFFVLPVSAALLLRPALTAAASVAAVAVYALIGVTYPDATDVRPDAVGFEFTQVLFLAWMGTAATLLSVLLTRRAREVAELATSRGRLVAQALQAEDTARRRLAEALHDEALQNLLAARQLLQAGDDPDLVLEGLDETVVQLRRAVFDLHPYLLEQSGLGAALHAVAEKSGRWAGFRADVAVDAGAEGLRDQLLFSVGRELIANAAKHSGAAQLTVRVRRDGDDVELVVADDGRGVDPARVREAPVDGHIGLASCAERAEAVGGTLAVGAGEDGRGTRVVVRVPVAAPAATPAVLA
jgi:two-component system NarL family sensor kinase